MWGWGSQRRNKRPRRYLNDDNSTDSSENESKEDKETHSMESEDSDPEDETNNKFKSEVYGLLKKVTNCGKGGTEFAISGKLTQVPNMLISIKDGGVMRFPIYENEIQNFIDAFEKSPYGKGTETVLDSNVRNSWELQPSGFQIMNQQWETYLKEVLVARVGKEFDVSPTTFTASLYKLLLYKTGSFFKVHRDSEKEDGMFGTLVVQLPSKYTGGQLVVNHDGKTKTIDFSSSEESNKEFETFFSAFYCDCEHEILPLTSGIRVCLIYNLAITKTGIDVSVPVAPRMTEIEGQVSSLLKDWEIHGGPTKIVYYLSHRYTEKNLSFENLKSSDKIIAKTLMNLSKQNDVTLLMGIFKKQSTGTSRGCSSSDFDSDDEDCYCERTYSLSHLKLLGAIEDAQNTSFCTSLTVDYENEVIPKDCFKNRSPYDHSSENTGNAGVSVSLFYRGAALVMFPSENIVDIFIEDDQIDSAATIFLNEFDKYRTSGKDVKTEAKLRKWATRMLQSSRKLANVGPMLTAIISFNDLKLLQNFLDRLAQLCENTIPLIINQCEKFGWASLSAQLVNQFKTLRFSTTVKLFKLVVEGGLEKEKEEVCHKLAQHLLESVKKQKGSASLNFWGNCTVKTPAEKQKELKADQEFLFDFCQTAKKINFDILDFAKSQSIRVLGPVLVKLSNQVDNTLDFYWQGLRAYVLGKMEAIAAKSVVVPNWRFLNYPSCGCSDCSSVNAFMKSDRISEGFKMGKGRRLHVHQNLNHFDNIQHETTRVGNPQTLVLTKVVMPNLDETEDQKLAKQLIPKLKTMTCNP